VAIGVLKLVHDMVMLSSPFVLQRLLQNLQDGGSRCAFPTALGYTCSELSCIIKIMP